MAAGHDLRGAVLGRERIERDQRVGDQRKVRPRKRIVAVVLVHPLATVARARAHRGDAGDLVVRAEHRLHQPQQPVVHEELVDGAGLGQQVVGVDRLLAVVVRQPAADLVENGVEAAPQPLQHLFVQEVGYDRVAVFADLAR